MSGVVNKAVADKAVAVRADELIRKPFQPQELISRVKSLLQPKSAEFAGLGKATTPSIALDKLFAPAPAAPAARPIAPFPTRVRLHLARSSRGPAPWPKPSSRVPRRQASNHHNHTRA